MRKAAVDQIGLLLDKDYFAVSRKFPRVKPPESDSRSRIKRAVNVPIPVQAFC